MVEHKGRLSGLIVDSASEVLKIPAADVDSSPTVFQESGLNCVTGLGKYRGRLIVLLDPARLVDYSAEMRNQAVPSEERQPPAGETRGAAAAK